MFRWRQRSPEQRGAETHNPFAAAAVPSAVSASHYCAVPAPQRTVASAGVAHPPCQSPTACAPWTRRSCSPARPRAPSSCQYSACTVDGRTLQLGGMTGTHARAGTGRSDRSRRRETPRRPRIHSEQGTRSMFTDPCSHIMPALEPSMNSCKSMVNCFARYMYVPGGRHDCVRRR